MVVGPILGIVAAVFLLWPVEDDFRILLGSELAEISPFLDSGHQRIHDGRPRFIGYLFSTWNYLPDTEREAAASEIARHFEATGVNSIVLLGVGPRMLAHWEDGEFVELTPKPAN